MFALRSPLSKGVLLADEVGLGKTIEAALVLAQRWWERRRHLLLIIPASLRKQWAQELHEKFSLPSVIVNTKRMKELQKAGQNDPLTTTSGIVILSYEFAARVFLTSFARSRGTWLCSTKPTSCATSEPPKPPGRGSPSCPQ